MTKYNRCITLLYHDVTDDTLSSGFQTKKSYIYTHGEETFQKHLGLIKEHGYKASQINGVNTNQFGSVLRISFDDGGKSFLHIARTLSAHSLVGIFFISTAFIGKSGFLSEDNIHEIDEMGHIIGSHSHSHPPHFHTLSVESMHAEWKRSNDILENILKKKIIHVSIPGGQISRSVLQIAAENQYLHIYTSEPSFRVKNIGSSKVYGRFSITKDTKIENVTRILEFRSIMQIIAKRAVRKYGSRIVYGVKNLGK